jgi:predicted permease
MSLLTDLRYALRSLARVKGLTFTVIVTLALGIGANAAMFSVVRGVLMRPLVNKDEDRLIYIRQSAMGMQMENTVFSVPEIHDLRAGVKSLTAFGDFSALDFTMIGLGEPRVIRAGVVGGNYFDVMGLKAVRGRLIGPADDGPNAAGAIVLTYKFWTTTLQSDPAVLGKQVRLGDRSAVIIGVLEPAVPYPVQTEIIANLVTSPHHLSATMQDGRVHRMTELFGRLAPNATLDQVRAELRTVHSAMVAKHPDAYPKSGDFRIDAKKLRDEIAAPARTILLVLLAASGLVFIIACSNVANLILARSVRREGELAIRAALGASTWALRRTLLTESLLLCGTGALLGMLIARPMMNIVARYASRFSVRAMDVSVDASVLWVGVGLALAAAVLLAFVPRLPSAEGAQGMGLSTGSVRITSGTNRRLRVFAITQIAASFVLLAGAGMLLTTLFALQSAHKGFDTRNVLAIHVPVIDYERPPDQIAKFYKEALRRIAELPGVAHVAVGTIIPWRDAGTFGPGFQFSVEGYARAVGEEDPRARYRTISPGFFGALNVPILAGRDFDARDRFDAEKVVIISQSVARRMFPTGDALNRNLLFTDPVMKFITQDNPPRRIVGIVGDIDDENIVPGAAMSVYQPYEQGYFGGRMFVHTTTDPYALVRPITKIIREVSPEQPVEQAATLEDVRAEVLAPNRLNALVFGGFAMVALTIAIVGVAGVLAFSVSARTREFGIRLAIGSEPRQLLTRVLGEGAVIAAIGIAVGVVAGLILARVVGGYIPDVRMPGLSTVAGAAGILVTAAILASFTPAARAARVDVISALRPE